MEPALLIVVKEKGFFAKHGMTGVEVLKQASWPAARDNQDFWIRYWLAAGGVDLDRYRLEARRAQAPSELSCRVNQALHHPH